MTAIYRVCPICEGRNHPNAALCATCGATIADIAPIEDSAEEAANFSVYEFRYGETDLAESSLRIKGRLYSAVLVILLMLVLGAAAAFVLAPGLLQGEDQLAAAPTGAPPTRIAGPSVTPGTPTATFTNSPIPSATPAPTSTPAPCIRKVAEGDSLIAIVSRCGHGSLAILPTVMALNRITDETRIQIGQEIIVPRPSPAGRASGANPPNDSAAAASPDEQLARLAFDPFAPTLTPTLLPGLMWHIVQPDEDMIYVAAVYNTDVKYLSDLNPELDFLLCDFSEVYGGPECTVQLSVNQYVRVPAPTATVTPFPTASGIRTETPVPTATYNAPIAQSPANAAFFSALEQVTLRWVGTGRLANNETYRIVFVNLDQGSFFSADTTELFFIIPVDWQSQEAGSHRYSWQVQAVNTDSNSIAYRSEMRTFLWQGLGKAGS